MKEKLARRLRCPRLWGAAAAVLVLAGVLLAAAYRAGGPGGVLLPGSSVAGVDVGGLSREAALERLEAALLPRYAAARIHLVEGDTLVAVRTWEELGAAPDLSGAVDALFAQTPQGPGWPDRLRRGWRRLSGREPPAVLPAVTVDPAALAASLPPQPENARYDKESGTVAEGRAGILADAEALAAALGAAEPGRTLRFQVQVREPELTGEALRAVLFRDVLGTCTTTVTGSAERVGNVRLSAAAVDGTVLNPGEVFDYNAVVGERTAEKGYGAAPAYVNGETVSEIGGGVCQTSSTLYLAAVRSDLAVTERVNHRYVSGYIPLGMDAAVSWGGPELRLQNDTAYPIRVQAAMEGGELTVTILGTKLDQARVEVTYEILATVPYGTEYRETDALPAGQRQVQRSGITGYTVQTYRSVYDAEGNLLRSAPEAKSVYQSRDALVLVGTKRPEAAESASPGAAAEADQEAPDPEAALADDPLPLRDLEQFQ